MKNNKDRLTDKQFHINQRTAADTEATKDWLTAVGLNAATFGTTHLRLLQAQQQAHALLTHHKHLLNPSQLATLEHFQWHSPKPVDTFHSAV